jgi:hypothetical protein
MILILRQTVWAVFIYVYAISSSVLAEETIRTTISLPGASLEQEVTYSTTKSDYESVRDGILKRLKEGDPTAMVNPTDGPWMKAETTAMIGLEVKGVGVSQGKVHKRQISAAEEAFYIFQAQ